MAEVGLRDIVVGLLGLGMLVKGWVERDGGGRCSGCILEPKHVEELGEFLRLAVGRQSTDTDGQPKWWSRDLARLVVSRQREHAVAQEKALSAALKESHDDHEAILRNQATIIAKLNGRQK